jgi:chemotaxis protein histidine kinase CheA
MIIANPIYDTAFKHLMENRRIARFFIETLIGEKIDEIALVPQEYVIRKRYTARKKKKNDKEQDNNENKKEEVFSILRYDFVATIRTTEGEQKKILIEIQKSRKPTVLTRFRSYVGVQYKRVDVLDISTKKIEKGLPLICVFLLGFTISKINAIVIKVARTCIDIIGKKVIKEKSEFIEALTHDGYFVQIPHIKGKPKTLLEEMLSVFEQQCFVDEKSIAKEYEHTVANEIIREMLDTLRFVAADPKERRSMEEEWWNDQDEQEYEEIRKELEATSKELVKTAQELVKKDEELEEERKAREAEKAEKEAAQAEKEAAQAEKEATQAKFEAAQAEKEATQAEKEAAAKALEEERKKNDATAQALEAALLKLKQAGLL